jgi:hypothetical protein
MGRKLILGEERALRVKTALKLCRTYKSVSQSVSLSVLRRDPVCEYARCAAGPNIE